MTLGNIANLVEKEESLLIRFWDPNMGLKREIEPDNLSKFILANSHIEVKQLIPSNYKLIVIIPKPY